MYGGQEQTKSLSLSLHNTGLCGPSLNSVFAKPNIKLCDDLDLILTWSSWRAECHFVPKASIKCRTPYGTLALSSWSQPRVELSWDSVSMTGRTTAAQPALCSPFSPVGFSAGCTGPAHPLHGCCSHTAALLWASSGISALTSRSHPEQHLCTTLAPCLLGRRSDAFVFPVPPFCIPCSTWVFLGDLLFAHGACLCSWGWCDCRVPRWGCEPEIPQSHLTHLRTWDWRAHVQLYNSSN